MTDTTPSQRAQHWLDQFAAALASGQPDATLPLFDSDCYWRDLVAFTWNIRTQEGHEAVRDMLAARITDTAASNFQLEGEATEADGITEAWFTFETRLARGRGHLRLKGDKAWTLLTTMTELKGFEEKKGERRIKGAEHGVHKGRKSWLELRQDEQARLGYAKQPHVVIIGGGQAGIILGARLRKLGRSHHHHREEQARGRFLAQPLQELVPARPGLVRPPALHPFPGRLAGLCAERQDR
jgi:putative flavoprotein involved in K+ transport